MTMAAYTIVTPSQKEDFKLSEAAGCRNYILELIAECAIESLEIDSICSFFLKEKPCTAQELKNACEMALEKKLVKKQTTHKLIWISTGATKLPNTWHQVWVPK